MKTIAAILLTLIPLAVSASGYGWYVSSFDWRKFSEWKTETESKVQIHRQFENEEERRDHETDLTSLVYRIMVIAAEDGGNDPFVIDESPWNMEFYWPKALEYAYKKSDKDTKIFFSYFESGRDLWGLVPVGECRDGGKKHWGYCMGAYVVLSPNEVEEFHNDLQKFNSRTKHPEEYQRYLMHLEGV